MAVMNEAMGVEWMRSPREHVTVIRGGLRHTGMLAVEPVGVWSEEGRKTEE